MAVRPVNGEKMEIAAEEEVKLPLQMKLQALFGSLVNPWVYRSDGTVNRRLENMLLVSKVSASSKPVNGVSTKDIVIDAANDGWVRVFTPSQQKEKSKGNFAEEDSSNKSDKKLPVIIFYHGGGFVIHAPDSIVFHHFCVTMAKAANAVVISVNYRLAPEFPYPTAYDDCYKAFEWMRSPDSRKDLPSADISQCFLMGDSAGGNITHHMGCRAAENDITPIKIRGIVLLQPFFGAEGDLSPSEINLKNPAVLTLSFSHWLWKAFLPRGANRDHGACNVFGPNGPDISGLSLPPLLVVMGSQDILQDYQTSYVKKLQEMGKDVTVLKYTGGFHGFYAIDVGNKVTPTAQADVWDFIRSHSL